MDVRVFVLIFNYLNMKIEIVKKINLGTDRYDPEISPFWKREQKSIRLAKDSFLKSEGSIWNNADNMRYILGRKESLEQIYVSYSPLYPKILKTIYDVCCEEDNKNDSAEIIFKKIFDDENLLRRIYYFDEYSIKPHFLENFNSFFNKIRIDTLLYFDDGKGQYYFELFRKLDVDESSSKKEFTGGILHSLTKHFIFFNHYHPKSNDILEFEFSNFTSSIVDISLNGETTVFKEGKYPDEYIIEREHELTDYYPKEEGKMFKIVLYQQSNKLNYLTSFYRF
jgi:hypothetical protein